MFVRIPLPVAHAYPLMLDVADRLIVIVGGGSVAVRKAQGVLAAGATCVRCVAPEFHPEMPPQVERVPEAFVPRHLDGAGLVFAATDLPGVNDAVVVEAHRRGLLVNRADADEQNPGDFSTPAIWRDSGLVVTVSTAGNPALAARVRDDLAGKIDPAHVQMARAMQELRPWIRDAAGLPIERRREIFRALSSAEAMDVIKSAGLAGLVAWLRREYAELSNVELNRG